MQRLCYTFDNMWANKNNNTSLVPSSSTTQSGFTIVETLIVLAVTGVMFITTMTLVRGQIARYQYQSSMRQLQVLIQRQIGDVQSGYFPEATNKDCNGAVVATLGKDQTCVIVGKRISLVKTTPDFPGDANHAADTANPSKLRVDTLGAAINTLPIEQTSGGTNALKYADYMGQIKFINTTYIDLPGDITYNAAACPGVSAPSCATVPRQWGDSIEINILYSSATRGAGGSSYYTSNKVVSSGDSTALYTNFLEKLSTFSAAQVSREGRLACFTNGTKFGSISFGNTSSGLVDLKIEDSRCRF
jgi:type II secretory pathway pseudopilin PulG